MQLLIEYGNNHFLWGMNSHLMGFNTVMTGVLPVISTNKSPHLWFMHNPIEITTYKCINGHNCISKDV